MHFVRFCVFVTAAVVAITCVASPGRAQSTPSPAAAPNAASPAAGAPVTIAACRGGIVSLELVEIASYDVTFHNAAVVAADEVRVRIRYGRHSKTADFDVHAALAPGADVEKHLRRTVSGGLYAYSSDQNDCTVDYVHFADGTSWSRPSRA